MDAVIRAEEAKGHRVVDVSADKCGWDLTSYPPPSTACSRPAAHRGQRPREGCRHGHRHRNEMLYAFNQGDKFVLAIVLRRRRRHHDGPYYIRKPFDREPGWGVSSINYIQRPAQAGPRGTHDHPVISPKKLIEVALPLDAINAAAAREKSIRHGSPMHTPSLVGTATAGCGARRHLRPARSRSGRPLALPEPRQEPNQQIKRALDKGPSDAVQDHRRPRVWENTTNEAVLKLARDEIRKLARDMRTEQGPPTSGGAVQPRQDARPSRSIRRRRIDPARSPAARPGGIRQRSQPRRGTDQQGDDRDPAEIRRQAASASDANNPRRPGAARRDWPKTFGATGPGCATRRTSGSAISTRRSKSPRRWSKERPDLKPYVGEKLTVIAWLWARTVKSPNPAFRTSTSLLPARSS